MQHPEVSIDPLAEIRIGVRVRCSVPLPWPHVISEPASREVVPLRHDVDEVTFGTLLGEVFRNYIEPFQPAQPFESASRDSAKALIRTARELEDRSNEAGGETPEIHLNPGLTVVASDGRRVLGGCCTCLCAWRDWYAVAEGEVLLLGHDPSARVALDGESVLAWSDTQSQASDIPAFGVRMTVDRLLPQLEAVKLELELFRHRVSAWVADHGDSAAVEWIESRLDHDLNVSRDFRPSDQV